MFNRIFEALAGKAGQPDRLMIDATGPVANILGARDYPLSIVSGQLMPSDLKFQGMSASISDAGQPWAMRVRV